MPTTTETPPPPPIPGKSLIPAFASDGKVTHEDLWWFHDGHRAYRVGDWKIVAAKGRPWELYDIGSDRSETTNLAGKLPQKVKELSAGWNRKLDEFTALATRDLPPSDNPKPAAIAKPVKVYILAGQSNMEGQAVVDLDGRDYNNGRGTLQTLLLDPIQAKTFGYLRDPAGRWRVRDDVWVRYQPEGQPLRKGPLSVGFAVYDDKHHFGPELGFGHIVGDQVDNPVLLIKTAWGGKSLFKDFRPPSSGGNVGPYYSKMVEEVRESLEAIAQDFPTSAGRYELAGLVWYQGWNDGVDPRRAIPEYEQNLVNLIQDLRKEWNAPGLPVVIGELTGPWVDAPPEWEKLRQAQAAAASRPELGGNVVFVPTRNFVRKPEDSPNPGHGHHEFGNAETYLLVGEALGRGMLRIEKSPTKPLPPTREQ